MRTALLRGRDHHAIGAVDTVAEGPAAIAISLGGRSKLYAHTDPNEDAALFAWSEDGTLLAVADGHGGFEAAEVAVEHLAEHPAPQWLTACPPRSGSWERQALAVLCDVNTRILREVSSGGKGPETTLALVLVLPQQQLLLHAAVGDSHIFLARQDGVQDLALTPSGKPGRHFLGRTPETPETLASRCVIGAAELAGASAVVLATDGLSESGIGVADPPAAVREAVRSAGAAMPDLRARDLARCVVETALAAHRRHAAGDNVGAAVAWLQPDPDGLRPPPAG